MEHDRLMLRCLQLARNGSGSAAPNPMVGALLVQGDRILAEGWHRTPGGPHAERACLEALGGEAVPADAILYVNLEPCAHHGRTPPCADLLIERGVKRLVVAHRDPFAQVNGKGLGRLRDAGVEVIEGVLADEARWINRRFITSVTAGRPYVVLKWAQSRDGFIDRPRAEPGPHRISSPQSDVLVHRWRSEEQAILVGSRTAVHDDPRLDVRHVSGRSPFREFLDRGGTAPIDSRLFDGAHPTLVFTGKIRSGIIAEQIIIDPAEDPIAIMLDALNQRSIRSILVEGGAELHGHFLREGLWDEARVITGSMAFGSGTPAPVMATSPCRIESCGPDRIAYFTNSTQQKQPHGSWHW